MSDTAKKIESLEAELKALKAAAPAPLEPVRLDFGCGKNKKEGFKGVDIRQFEGVDFVVNLATEKWPWFDESVDEGHCSHFIEHLTWPQRVHFFNELGRVLKKGAKATLIWPHWASDRFYGDPTHQQPMSGMALFYLNKDWRAGNKERGVPANAPHCDFESNEPGPHFWHEYTCDFDNVLSFSVNPAMNGRSQEYVQHAMAHYKDAAMDVMATLIKK